MKIKTKLYMETNNYEDTIMTYVGGIEFEMTLEDAMKCSHQGSCDDDVNEVSLKPYIQNQLKNYSNKEIANELKEYAIENTDKFNRETLEEYVVWLAAANIMDYVHNMIK